jgi:manganese/iron transport system ATP-binding protein
VADKAVLQVRNLTVDLAGRQVLHDVDLTVHAGELVSLIGPNGAGKTTLLRAVLALTPVRSGEITIDGRSAIESRGRLGYVPQRHDFAWDFPISVEKAVMSGRVHRIGWLRRAQRLDRDAVEHALERVDMTALRTRPIGELSGGQRQRVLVARALALQPRLMLLDEPFTGLDVPTQELLTTLFARLVDEGNALMMTTHDLAAAAGMSTRLCLLNKTVVATGRADELRDPAVWLRAFGVAQSEGLLRTMGADA